MRFHILGPLEVRGDDGAVTLGGIKPRAVLAVLLLHANEPVSAERLALALWGEDAAGGATKTVQVHVSRLRKALGAADMISTTAAGYCLRVGPDELDAEQFERLVEDGRRALAGGRPEQAAAILREALALWRGPPLAELAFEPFARAEIARLEEQRLAALEARVEADLGSGRHAELVAELRQLVAENPTREGLTAQLVLALYRCGRQADALEAYQDARRVLVAEIGVEPGPRLRELQEAILRQDVSLEPGGAVPELPPELDAATAAPLVGRQDELAWLRLRWERARGGSGGVVIVAGERGAGKTRIAAELAGDAQRRGDTVLYADGRGPPGAALGVLGALGDARGPTLLVVDDADAAGADVLARLDESTRGLAGLPVLVLACCADANALGGLRSDGVLTLEPLAEDAVRSIGGHYASGRAPADVPAQWLLEASGGLPRRIHEVASQWARREAARRVTAVAERAQTERTQLSTIQHELAGGVIELQEAHERILARRTGEQPVVCPFKGLASYEIGDAEYFFGRERLVAELVARLAGAPLLAVVGPSGSGKSSVMRAGLLPALASGVLPGSEDWGLALMRPGEHPVRELAAALAARDGDRRVVLAVDQFEETFTVCDDETERDEFISELVSAAQDPGGRYVVVLALRADYYGSCAAYPALSSLLAGSNVLVRSMQRDELRRAVEGPCRRAGLRIEDELVEALVADVEREPGGLPLLSTALLELWQRRDGRRLRHGSYVRSGGVHGAVARLAEDAFAQLDDAQQAGARGVLMRLVAVGAGDAVERRRVALDELEIDRDESVARAVALLTDRRLLTVGAGGVEFAHEALLREWPRVRGWIEEDREGLRIQRSVSAAAQEWERLQRDEGGLYRGAQLDHAIEWRSARAPALTELEREFLAASEAVSARERVTRRRRAGIVIAAAGTALLALCVIAVVALFAERERDIAASRDLATRSATVITTDPGLALAIAREALRRSGTEQARTAVRQATLAHRATRAIAAHDSIVFGVAPTRDGRLAATAGEDRTVRIWNLGSGRRVGEIRGYRGEVRGVSFSRDGRRVASVARDGEIAVAAAGGGRREVVARLEGDFAASVDFGADGGTLAIGTQQGRVAVVRLSDGAVRDLGPRHAGFVFAVAFDRDARRVVSAGEDGVARIWDVAGGRPLELVHGRGNPIVLDASFSPDGERVATVALDGVLRLWDASSGRVTARIRIGKPLASVRFSGDGRRIVTADADGVIHLIAVGERAVLAEFRGHRGPARANFVGASRSIVSAGEEDGTLRTFVPPATSVPARAGRAPMFSRDGRLVVSGDPSGLIHLWNPATGKDRGFTGHAGASYPQLSPDGSQIVSASDDGSVRLWDVASGSDRKVPTLADDKHAAAIDASGRRIAIGGVTPLVIQAPDGSSRVRLRGQGGRVNALVFSRDGRHLLTGSDDGTARIWDARRGVLERPLRGHEGVIRGVSYSDDMRRVATAGSDGTVRVWPVAGGDAAILVGHEGAVNTVEFSPRGDRVVSAGDDGTIRVWDAAGGEALVVLQRYEGIATGADFSADGRAVVSAGDGGMRLTACEVCASFQDVLRVARSRAQRTLTAAERRLLLTGG